VTNRFIADLVFLLKFIIRHAWYRCIFLFVIFCSFSVVLSGQVIGEDLKDVRVDELSDDQIRRLITEMNRLGVKDEQLEQLASQMGMNTVEIAKLRERVRAMIKVNPLGTLPSNTRSTEARITDSLSREASRSSGELSSIFSGLKPRNFADGIFSNPAITFEPNLRIPTPSTYQLAADDELQIDVFGNSEASYKLKVTPEGSIRIPLVGPVSVNGLTVEQAKKSIVKKLSSTIYTDIRSGLTSVEVSLGSVRSIRVMIIGEASVPGTFTLSSLATVYNALYACGGPNTNGSYRDIQLIRNNLPIATIDVYQFLVNGNKKNDLRLMDQDIIRINTYQVRVELKGEVKKPGLFDVLPGETMSQIIGYAGGYTDNAYTSRIQVYRNNLKERELTSVLEDNLKTLIPQRGDQFIIGKILNRFTNRISIRGAIYRPGEYELKEGMTLSQLIREADGLREDAFLSRAIIHRLKQDLTPEILSVDLENILHKGGTDLPLKKEDRVQIFSRFDLKEGFFVKIEGEVSEPGVFVYEEGITLQDLVMLAGGLKESASLKKIEVSRRIKNQGADSVSAITAVIYEKTISTDLRDSTDIEGIILQPFDEVSVRPVPGYTPQANVVIEGEVIYTGKYSLEKKTERISDLVKRSGGFTPQAYLKGAVLVRTRNLSKTELSNANQGLSNLIKQNAQSSQSSASIVINDLVNNAQKRSDNVGIDLERIMEEPGSELDLFLNDGDTLRIPKLLQTVRVNGEVLYPALVRYDKAKSFKDYILGAGGFSDRSSKKRSYVVYANGSVKGTRSFLFFKNYPKLSPGAEIYVPVKRERERLRTGEWVTLGATLVSMLAILYNVFR
jgi:protein involved in polysaccharide export with SLBB domain